MELVLLEISPWNQTDCCGSILVHYPESKKLLRKKARLNIHDTTIPNTSPYSASYIPDKETDSQGSLGSWSACMSL